MWRVKRTAIVQSNSNCTVKQQLYSQTAIVQSKSNCTVKQQLYSQTAIVQPNSNCTVKQQFTVKEQLYSQRAIVQSKSNCTVKQQLYSQRAIVQSNSNCTVKQHGYVDGNRIQTVSKFFSFFVADRLTPRNAFLAKQRVSQSDNKHQILDGIQMFIGIFFVYVPLVHMCISQIHNI